MAENCNHVAATVAIADARRRHGARLGGVTDAAGPRSPSWPTVFQGTGEVLGRLDRR